MTSRYKYRLRSCPRCGGDIQVDYLEKCETCIQCGFTMYLDHEPESKEDNGKGEARLFNKKGGGN